VAWVDGCESRTIEQLKSIGIACEITGGVQLALAHHTLVAWQRADDLFLKLHRLSLKAFPAFEKYELGGQLRRSAFSVAVNIVEGFATEYGRRRVNFLNVSQSSLAEVGYCIHAAHRLGYVDEKVASELDLEIRRVGAPLAGLIASERLKIKTATAGLILLVFLLGSRLS
jgi:four helix bundle protein